MLVAAERTALTPEQVREYVRLALPTSAGNDAIALLMSMIAQETGKFEKLWNYNFGNITTDGSWPDGWYQLRHRDASENVLKYRNYKSFEDGMTDLVRLLRARYSTAYRALLAGDAENFVRSLKTSGYFTGNADIYLRNVVSFMRDFGGTARPPLPEATHPSPSSSVWGLPTLRYGQRSDGVRIWQHLIGAHSTTGYFDTLTLVRTRAWQELRGLTPDGIVGPLTWGKVRLP